jgi:hypothetical protein
MRSTRILAAATSATAICVLSMPALAAGDRIVHGRSIGVIAVGEERATIGAALGGDGVVIARTPDPQAPGNRNFDAVTVAYPALALTVRFPTDEASSGALSVSTRSTRYRTAGGVGVGSPRARILAAFPRALCTVARCQVGPRAGDVRITRFSLSGGRAARVTVLSAP